MLKTCKSGRVVTSLKHARAIASTDPLPGSYAYALNTRSHRSDCLYV